MNILESPSSRGREIARIRRLSDERLQREARARYIMWHAWETPSYRSFRCFLYRVCVNVLQERGLPIPQ